MVVPGRPMKSMPASARRLILATLLLTAMAGPIRAARDTESFDTAWRFFQGDAPDAANPAFDDAGWKSVDVPHDWAIAGPFDQGNPAGGAGAFLPSGVAWYRKSFTLPADAASRRIFIEFDGVMANSDVFINGTLLGHRPDGYVGLRYELTGHLSFGAGKTNVLAVSADTSQQPASRWFAGAGIYRHVRLVVTDAVHLDLAATFVTASKVTEAEATVHLRTTVVNQSAVPHTVDLQSALMAPNVIYRIPPWVAPSAPQTIAPGQSAGFEQDIVVSRPPLWSVTAPLLWQAAVQIREGDVPLDREVVPFGIRDAQFGAMTGFSLNGQTLKLNGVCLHDDGGAFGAAVPLAVWEQRLATLKSIGVNAIRTAHNPPDPGLLDLCDRMGFAVMLETFDTWRAMKPNQRGGYQLYFPVWWEADTRAAVLTARNHPCVVLYSIGNEIRDNLLSATGHHDLVAQRDLVHQLDPTRPVTMGLFRPQESGHIPVVTDLLDVVGINYRPAQLALMATAGRPTVDTEETHAIDRTAPIIGDARISGQFLWTGVDYLGESLGWPAIGQDFGLLDRTGAFQPRGWQRQSWWSATPMVKILRRTGRAGIMALDPGYETAPEIAQRQQSQAPVLFADWTPRNPAPHNETIEVYSNCDEVELLLNGRSLGKQPLVGLAPRTWSVPYEAGTLMAVGSTKGRKVATDEIHTAGRQARIELVTNRTKLTPGWDEVAEVRATVVDANGVRIYPANDLVRFEVAGPGVVAAVDNGDLNSHESFQGNVRHAFNGSCVAWIRATASTGTITVRATTGNLDAGTVAIAAGP